jgi:RimJ/RimL family protein N-acetyltransferase
MQLLPETLEDEAVRLEPYHPTLREELRDALNCDPAAWDLFSVSGYGEHFDGWWTDAMAAMEAGDRVAYAVRRKADNAVLGTTSYLAISTAHRTVEVGATFYSPDVRGGSLNPRCKLLLLSNAFEAGANRVQLVTDGRNLRSQAAIAKLGAQREGVLRRHRITWTGHVRDTVVCAVIDEDWPAVEAGLRRRIGV